MRLDFEFGLKSLCDVRGKTVKVFTDNMTAVAYVRRQGVVKSLDCNAIAQVIWSWCEVKGIWLRVAHIPGVENKLADFKSRNFADNVEWTLSDKIYTKVEQIFGSLEVDLFATRLNAKVAKYVSWKPDPDAFAIDAFEMC